MKRIIFFAMLVVSFASCDTTSTATGSSEKQADTSAVNSSMPSDSGKMTNKDTSATMSKPTMDTATKKTDTIPK